MTLRETRKFIFKQMKALEQGKISVDEALTQSKLATRVIESYNVELKAIELAASMGTPIGSYQEALVHIGE
jgi:hypothetical protein